jgi:hypothetical protein
MLEYVAELLTCQSAGRSRATVIAVEAKSAWPAPVSLFGTKLLVLSCRPLI